MENPACPVGPNGRKTERMPWPGGMSWMMRRARYIVKTMKARVRPAVTRKTDETIVMRQWYIEYLWIAEARRPPEEEATVRVTTGSNHLAVMVSRECFWFIILGQGQQN